MKNCEKRNGVSSDGMENSQIPCLTLTEEEDGSGFQHHFSVRETYPLHTHTFYEFFLISKGRGIHRINGSSTLLSEGSFVLIRPSDRHGYDFLNQYDLELINVSFLPSIFESLCRLFDCPPSLFTGPNLCPQIQLQEPLLSDIRGKMLQFERFSAKKECQGSEKRQYLLSVLPWFLYPFLRVLSQEKGEPSDKVPHPLPGWLSGLLRQMERPENYTAGLPRLIELANLSQEYLTRSFRRYLHMTPTEFINLRRMELAASLLLEGKMEIIEISQECGFHNLGYFYRVFQKQYGCAPGEFKRQASFSPSRSAL
ncbi:MAG TPA: AraC family transcriptional regulator [Candidatus Eisenbergiella merdipullorum]|uniref:AraC family transcriptional regulator n=1 Tax=Candidatus Eisenbergiella merdipullorum TaxID=2838553 RepID=A0A9D2L0C6_9FIRM|nr:AraC family transcriptional regulator [Candidatus Eisenbergiella merdipullorum]